MNRAVFLDRDGVINTMVYNTEFGLVDSPANPAEFRFLPAVAESIRVFNQLGFLVIVISNQPGIAKGKFSPALLEAMTQKMLTELAEQGAQIEAVFYCMHHPEGAVSEFRAVCDCRKPKPGLLLRAADQYQIDLGQSYFIGDGITDVQAGQAAGTRTILLYPSSHCYLCDVLSSRNVKPDAIMANLWEAAIYIQAEVTMYKTESA